MGKNRYHKGTMVRDTERIDTDELPLYEGEEAEIPYGISRFAITNFGRGFIISNKGNITQLKLNGYKGNTHKFYNVYKDNGIKTKISPHKLVGRFFVEGYAEDKDEIIHIDGNLSNNHYKNLKWVSKFKYKCHLHRFGGLEWWRRN
jgi:hypothetical protein